MNKSTGWFPARAKAAARLRAARASSPKTSTPAPAGTAASGAASPVRGSSAASITTRGSRWIALRASSSPTSRYWAGGGGHAHSAIARPSQSRSPKRHPRQRIGACRRLLAAPPCWGEDPRAMGRILLSEGDITAMTVDAIVNAANTRARARLGRGGGDLPPRRRGDPDGVRRAWAGPARRRRAHAGGKLPARFVIHAAAMQLGRSRERRLAARRDPQQPRARAEARAALDRVPRDRHGRRRLPDAALRRDHARRGARAPGGRDLARRRSTSCCSASPRCASSRW